MVRMLKSLWCRLYLPAYCLVLVLSGCETPARRDVMLRMDRLQAENSAVKAKTESEVANVQIESVRQRQDDIKMIEALNQRIAELTQKVEALNRQTTPGTEKPPFPSPAPAIEPAKPAAEAQADLERVKQEARAQMAKMEETLAKAQAQAETAKLAAAALEKGPREVTQKGDWKAKKMPLTKFIDSSGKLVDISQYLGKQVVVLTVMKGFYSQGVCVYCTRQTADFARNAQAFRDLNVELLVVYPGGEEHINTFVRSVRDYEKSEDPRFKLPFKVLLDVNQDAVRILNIAGDLAHPTTFIIDKSGEVRYEYVGRTMSDRPTASDILTEVKKIGEGQP